MTRLSFSDAPHRFQTDARLGALMDWLQFTRPGDFTELSVASDDASFRRYFRVTQLSGQTLIAMDAPPDQENSSRFVRMTGIFARAGAAVPKIHAINLAAGFLLLEDFGSTDVQSALCDDPELAANVYTQALDSLLVFQQTTAAGLADYDAAAVRRELDLFPTWYVRRHCQRTWHDEDQQAWQALSDEIVRRWQDWPRVLVHRDYHSRNLMRRPDGQLGIIDYQDAVSGPFGYDVVSLLKDAYVDLGATERTRWLDYYYEHARRLGILNMNRRDVDEAIRWCGIQRHLKVMGIFARLCHRDGKKRYLADLPLVRRYLQDAVDTEPLLQPVLRWIAPPLGERESS